MKGQSNEVMFCIWADKLTTIVNSKAAGGERGNAGGFECDKGVSLG